MKDVVEHPYAWLTKGEVEQARMVRGHMRPESPHGSASEWPDMEKTGPVSEGRPGVGGFVILCLFTGVVGLCLSSALLNELHEVGAQASVDPELEGWVALSRSVAYFGLVSCVLELVAALLIAQYRRLGLYLCGGLYLAYVGQDIFLTANPIKPAAGLSNVVAALVIFQVYRYLTIPRFSKHFT